MDYDSANIAIDPRTVGEIAAMLIADANEVAEARNRIAKTLSGSIFWAGLSHDESEDMTARWVKTGIELFGSSPEPEDPAGKKPEYAAEAEEIGVLSAMAGGLTGAAAGYSQTETAIALLFTQMHAGIQPESRPPGEPEPPSTTPLPGDPSLTDQTDPALTAIGEDW
ncbi:hypothetical protein [Streptomyces shenzhenensis]|uniref:hypothetical protein n=1 Tax=Streptomyces shenzhenensis TaxID=943815 RepID=UPI0036BD32CD